MEPMQQPSNQGSVENSVEFPSPRIHDFDAKKKDFEVESLHGKFDHERVGSVLLSHSHRDLRARPRSLKSGTLRPPSYRGC
jgi:hypothetical protein